MELAAACILFFNLVSNAPMSLNDHSQAEKALFKIAPKCEGEIKKVIEDQQKAQQKK